MLPFSGNNQQHKNVRSSPEHFVIGYVHKHNLLVGNKLYCITIFHSKQLFEGLIGCFLMISCTFWRARKHVSNSPKLSCGFKCCDGSEPQRNYFRHLRILKLATYTKIEYHYSCMVQIGNFLDRKGMYKYSYLTLSTQNIKFYWFVMKIKKFV